MTLLDLEGMDLEEAVGISIGAASMCWTNPGGAGEFDSTRAANIVEELLDKVRSYVK